MELNKYDLSEWQVPFQHENGAVASDWQYMYQRLEQIGNYLEKENELKQATINKQLIEIDKLKKELEVRNSSISSLKSHLHECRESAEGNRQLINKLLNDISQHQNNIEWYKRTYEKRSIWGILRQKIGKRS